MVYHHQVALTTQVHRKHLHTGFLEFIAVALELRLLFAVEAVVAGCVWW